MRRDLGTGHPPARLIYVAAIATLLALTSWHAQELWLTLYVVGGSFATTAALALCGWLLVLGLRPLCRRVGIAWRYGLANSARRGAASVAQPVALGLGIMAILLLTVARGDLRANWQDAPAPRHWEFASAATFCRPVTSFSKATQRSWLGAIWCIKPI